MVDVTQENATSGVANDTGLESGATSATKPEENVQLEAQKAQLEAEITGLEGAKSSLISELDVMRKQRTETPQDTTPQVDIELIKKEVEDSILNKVSADITSLKQELVKAKESEITAKKALVESINARMASVSGSSGQSSPDSITENTVELSEDEKKIVQEFGIQNPRYLKEVEIR